jgi:tRNA(Ile)-lysidine synthase
MHDLHRDIAAFLRHAGVGRGEPLLVALSGGADSTALLCALCAMGLRVGAAHVHHGLRGAEADADAEFAVDLAGRLGVPVQLARVDAAHRDGRSPEARARRLRYAALESLRAANGYPWIATAHTLDDQAETVLLRALRGTAPLGLSGISPRDPERRLLRPLLGVRRAALRAYLAARGQSWREDSTNLDLDLSRNRLRAEVMPALVRVQPDAELKLARLADQARAWGRPLRAAARAQLDGALEAGDGGEWLALAALAGAADPQRRTLLALWLGAGDSDARASAPHVQRAAELAERGETGRALSLPGGRVLFRDRDALWLGPAPGPRFPAPLERWLTPPDGLVCPERDLRFDWAHAGTRDSQGWPVAAGSRVRVRSPGPGDAIRTDPGRAPLALRELFARAAWTRRRRARALVVEQDGCVVWVPGLARATPAHEVRQGWKLVAGRLSTPGDTC